MIEMGTLIKFGSYEHLEQLRNEGILYMNNLPYFWKIEDEELRGDPNDGINEIQKGNKGRATLEDGSIITVTNWELRNLPPNAEYINIFCMYAFRPTKGTYPINEANYKFGEYALILLNRSEFLKRVSNIIQRELIIPDYPTPKADLVEYLPNDYLGQIGLFKKFQTFKYQSEWRFVCYGGPGGPRKLLIGSLKDFSIIVLSEEVNQRIFVFDNDKILIR